MNNDKQKNREIIVDVLKDYTKQKEELRNKKGKINHLGETPSMFNDTRTYLVYLDTRRLLRELVPHSNRQIKDIINDLMELYNGDLESKIDVLLSKKQMKDLDVDEIDYEWTNDKTTISYTTDSNNTLFGYYNSLGYEFPNENISQYKSVLSKLDLDDINEENTNIDLEGTPSYQMIRDTISIYVPILNRMLIGKKEDYTWDEMIRQHKWEEYPL